MSVLGAELSIILFQRLKPSLEAVLYIISEHTHDVQQSMLSLIAISGNISVQANDIKWGRFPYILESKLGLKKMLLIHTSGLYMNIDKRTVIY